MDTKEMLVVIANAGGTVEYPETAAPFDRWLIDSATAKRLLAIEYVGGAFGAEERLALTRNGWLAAGIKPPTGLWYRTIQWLRSGLYSRRQTH